MIRILSLFLGWVVVFSSLVHAQKKSGKSLADLRAAHKTELVKKKRSDEAIDVPPADAPFTVVKYDTKIGKMSAYLSKPQPGGDDKKPKKGPAIVWLTGGLPPASPGPYLWESTSTSNEQSARIYRLRGVTMMFPTVRGTIPGNPGHQEWFYGEVDDVVSACEFLLKQPNVDPKRVYIGGHSSGGTLALLAAASTDKVAGVISFGPTDTEYEPGEMPCRFNDRERHLRWPIKHLDAIKVPTYVIGGEIGDKPAMLRLKAANKGKNKNLHFHVIDKANHFNVIHPANSILSRAVVDSKDGRLEFDVEKLAASYVVHARRTRETKDLELLAKAQFSRATFDKPKRVSFYLFANAEKEFTKDVYKSAREAGFTYTDPEKFDGARGQAYYAVVMMKTVDLNQLDKLFAATAAAEALAEKHRLHYDDWTLD